MHILHAANILFALLALLISVPTTPAYAGWGETPYDGKGATIYAYHRIGEDGFPDTNLKTALFEAHIRELTTGDYNVLPVTEIIKALKNNERLPPRTIGITFEGGHKSILDKAVPLLQKHNLPFTVFISTDKADADISEYLNWSDIKKLHRNKNVTMGLHSASYTRITGLTDKEIRAQINNAKTIYTEHLQDQPKLFAYPFGEYSKTYRNIISKSGFSAGFGQQSSVAWPGDDIYALPRFTMTDSYADLDRFRLTANALPLPVDHIKPNDPFLSDPETVIGFNIHKALLEDLNSLSCFSSMQGSMEMTQNKNRIEIRHNQKIEQSRLRINCTLPGPQSGERGEDFPRWRWFGMLMNMKEPFQLKTATEGE